MAYIILGTLIALGGLIYGLKWKISTLAIVWYCEEKFRPPTDTEIDKYTRKVVEKLLKQG